jgi:hypothetical protein
MAEEVIRELLACSGKLDHSVATLQGQVNDDIFIKYRKLVGQAMGHLYLDLLRDLFKQYPDLEPDSMKSRGSDLATEEIRNAALAVAHGEVQEVREALRQLRSRLSSEAETEVFLVALDEVTKFADQMTDLLTSAMSHSL